MPRTNGLSYSKIGYFQYMNRFWKYSIDHVLFWIATVGFHMFTRMELIGTAGPGQFVLEVIIRNGLLAAIIYVNLLVLIPTFGKRKMQYIVLLLVSVGAYVLLKNAHDMYLNGYVLGDESKKSLFYNSYYNFSIAIFYLTFSIALHLSKA